MIKTSWLSILTKQRFNFGDRPIDQYILFECKYLFGIMFFCFRKSENIQDRFHTLAVYSISFKFCGSYDEHVLDDFGNETIRPRTNVVQFFERNVYHKIGKSKKDTWTLLLTGPWLDYWKEINDQQEISKLTWSRKPAMS